MKKTAIAVAAGAAAAIGTLSLMGAGDQEVISTPGPLETVVATPTVEATPEPTTAATPADVLAEVPADPEQPAAVQPAPEDLPWDQYEEAVPWVPGAPIDGEIREPYEDEPGFDCRIHGNNKCGVEIMGSRYVVAFDQSGLPTGAYQL